MENQKLILSASPHIHKNISISKIMYTVGAALIPALVWAIFIFGFRTLWFTLIACVTAILTEACTQFIIKRKITALDGSALLTGILLAFNLPPGAPLWLPVIGSVFAILVAKQTFGGLGYNFINPALAGRAFLLASWPQIMSHNWATPMLGTKSAIGTITSSTPLSFIKSCATTPALIEKINSNTTIMNLFFGRCGGCIGEISAFLILLGGIFLIAIKYIDFRIPVSYIGTVGILTEIFHLLGVTPGDGIFHILSGGLFLGAFFMATDYVTSPITRQGRWLFGVGCGAITVLIRLWGPYPEGVCYSILLMNCFVPLIDRTIRPKKFGESK